MKTTLNIDDELLRRAKRIAVERGVTLTSLIEAALRDALRPVPSGTYRLTWTTKRGRRRPPVDPADRDALYEVLERRA